MTGIPAPNTLAPTGALRVGINYGNVVLAAKDAVSGELRGVHVDLARALAQRADVPLTFVGYASAGEIVEALKAGALDAGFITTEPSRAGEIDFTTAYLEIEATYLVPPGSRFGSAAEVDCDGTRIAIAAKSAYEHFLHRTLRHAMLIAAPSTHAAFDLFVKDKLDALVGLRPRLVLDAAMLPGSRVLDGHFMVMKQTIASQKGREFASAFLRAFVEDAKTSGLIARTLAAHGVRA